MFALSKEDRDARASFRAYIDKKVFPFSNKWEEREQIPDDTVRDFAESGYLGASLSALWGGMELSSLIFGLLCAEIARGSMSLLSMLTVHTMTAQAILRWGDDTQKSRYLPLLSSGNMLAAFALTEPDTGSDASSIETGAVREGDGFILDGVKKWISCATRAGLFLVIARIPDEGPAAFLLERDTPGMAITPMKGLLGFRAAGVAEIRFDNCCVGADSLLGIPGVGFSYVASHALDHGRYCVGWGGVGVIGGCVEACADYARNRIQFGRPIRSHQLIQAMVADMATDFEAATSLAMHAAASRETMEPESIILTSMSKYFSSKASLRASSDAVQIHGGNGCGPDYPVQRYFRDAKICEIIEGSSQMQQLMISRDVFTGVITRRRERRTSDEG